MTKIIKIINSDKINKGNIEGQNKRKITKLNIELLKNIDKKLKRQLNYMNFRLIEKEKEEFGK